MDRQGARALRYRNRLSFTNKLLRLLWGLVYLVLFRTTPRFALHGWRRMLLRLFGARIGEGSKIAPSCRIWAPWNLSIGNYSALAEGVDCYCAARIDIGSKVAISQRSFLCSASHDIGTLKRELILSPILIQDNVWVAAEAFVGPGVTIGEGAVIGARGVVTKDVAPWTIVAGNPARVIKRRQVHDIV